MDFTTEIALPNMAAINTGLSYPTSQFMIDLLGMPRVHMTDDCMPVTNPLIKKNIVTASVGEFNVTGLKPATESLIRIFKRVKQDDPALYEAIGTAGMLCVRRIRGAQTTPSNHSWGCAIDLTVNKRIDDRGDGKCFVGLMKIYPYFQNEGWWWGAEYRGPYEDSMHFDCSTKLLLEWRKKGLI